MTAIKSIFPQTILPIRLDRFVYEFGDSEIMLEATTPLTEEKICVSLNFSDLNTLLLRTDADVREQLEDAIAEVMNTHLLASVLDVQQITDLPIYVFFPELLECVNANVELKKAS